VIGVKGAETRVLSRAGVLKEQTQPKGENQQVWLLKCKRVRKKERGNSIT